jgi:hypothetical protein
VFQRSILEGEQFFVDAHRGDGKRFVVRADEKLTAFMELEAAVRSRLDLIALRITAASLSHYTVSGMLIIFVAST